MLYGALDRSRGLSLQVTFFSKLSTRRMLDAIGTDARVVVSTYPLASQVLGRLRASGRLRVPVVTYMTVYEARACRLPVVTYRTLPGHGETNAQSLDEAGTAPWVRDAADLRVTLE